MSQDEHKAQAPARVRVAVLTISDTRSEASDTSGQTAVDLLTSAGHDVIWRRLVKDDAAAIAAVVREAVESSADVLITTGGTGITSRDSSYEAIHALFDTSMDGFGELFRMLSYHDIGPAAMMSRACAGLIGRTVVAVLPGAQGAVRLALEKLLIPELGHLVQQARK